MTGPAVDPLADYQQGWQGQGDPLAGYHPAWKSGAPAAGAIRQPIDIPEYTPPAPMASGIGMKILGTLGSLGRDIPGVEAAQAWVRSGGRTLAHKVGLPVDAESYRQAFANIHGLEDAAPAAATIPARLIGGGVAAMALPGSPAVAGGLLGVGSGLLSSDPNAGLQDRAVSAAIQGGVGALTGRLLDRGAIAARANLPGIVKTSAQNVIDREAARGTIAKPLYKAFRDLGDLGSTPELEALIGKATPTGVDGGLPVIRNAIAAVKGESPTLAKLPDTDASVLDAAYKRVGSKAFKSLHAVETGEARSAFLDAIDGASQAKGVSYKGIVTQFADASKSIAAVQRGSDLVKSAGNSLPAGRALNKNSIEAFRGWAASASPAEKDAAVEGLLGGLKKVDQVKWAKVLGVPVLPHASTAMAQAPGLLRTLAPSAVNIPKGLLAVPNLLFPNAQPSP